MAAIRLAGNTALLAILAILASTAAPLTAEDTAPSVLSMSTLAFGPEGILFVGDGKAGAVHALEIPVPQGTTPFEGEVEILQVDRRIAALLGTKTEDVMVHDLAVDPRSGRAYLAVSRGAAAWDDIWLLPNDVADADLLIRVDPDGTVSEVPVDRLERTSARLPNPVEDKPHVWKEGISQRAETVTDLAWSDGTLFVAGLSNEEFASTMWRIPYPFGASVAGTTLEIFHGAHGKWETASPVRAFVPYTVRGKQHLLAAYLCTPFVAFPTEGLADGEHVRGRTLAEFGSGNFPLDMVPYTKNGEDRIAIANSNLPLLVVKASDIEAFEGEITEEVEGYVGGLPAEYRAGGGIVQMDRLNDDFLLVMVRQPSGKLDLRSYPIRRL